MTRPVSEILDDIERKARNGELTERDYAALRKIAEQCRRDAEELDREFGL